MVKELRGQVAQLQSARQSVSSEQHKQLQAKVYVVCVCGGGREEGRGEDMCFYTHVL